MAESRKRRRTEEVFERIIEEALGTLSQISLLHVGDLAVEGCKTVKLPLAGFGNVVRPPKNFDFVGRPVFRDIAAKIASAFDSGRRCFILAGAKGVGKSCILRAYACLLYGRLPSTWRVLCFWHFDAAGDLARQVQEAFLFAFCKEAEVREDIISICMYEDAGKFLRGRRNLGEKIFLITDGEERLDIHQKNAGNRSREEARTWLHQIGTQADFIIKALSPNARELEDSAIQGSPFVYSLDSLFKEEEYKAYMEGTVLGEMLQIRGERKEEVAFLVGRHPQSLDALIQCCRSKAGDSPSLFWKATMGDLVSSPVSSVVSGQAQLDNILDNEDWKQVVENFTRSFAKELLKGVDIASLKLESLTEVSTKLTAYVVAGDFCTPFIRQVYTEAASEAISRSYKCPEWTSYVKLRLSDTRGLNWAEWGWLCENLVSDMVKTRGLKLTGLHRPEVVSVMKALTVRRIEGAQPEVVNTAKWKAGDGLFLLPDKFWFKYVDFVVLVKIEGELHLIGGQSTTNPDNHRKTERNFMRKRNIAQWIGEGVKCQVHYAYLCPERQATNLPELANVKWTGNGWELECSAEGVQGQKGKQHRLGQAGSESEDEGVNYVLHVAGYSECFPGIGIEEKDVLTRLARQREEAVANKKAAKKASAEARWAEMDSNVRKCVKNRSKAYLQAKAGCHGIEATGTKETIVKALLQAQVMVGCGNSGKECRKCASIPNMLKLKELKL